MEVIQECLIFFFTFPFWWFGGFSLLHPFQQVHNFCLWWEGAICFLLSLSSSAYFLPTFHILFIFAPLLFLSLFPPHACTHTHDQILRVLLIFPFLPSHPLFFLWDSQAKNATRTACARDMLILQNQSQSPYFHQERHRGWDFFHWPQRFLLPKIQNALLLPPLSLKVAQLLPSWMKTNFRWAMIPRCICTWHKCRLKSSDPKMFT